MKHDPKILLEQMAALQEYAENVLGEECTVCLYSDGSMMLETPVTYEKHGRGFGFDTFDELERKLPRHIKK